MKEALSKLLKICQFVNLRIHRKRVESALATELCDEIERQDVFATKGVFTFGDSGPAILTTGYGSLQQLLRRYFLPAHNRRERSEESRMNMVDGW